MNYRKDIETNVSKLDEAWLDQPGLYMYYSEQHADATMERDKEKEKLDLLYAQLTNEILSCNDKKPADSVIKAEILVNERYIAQQDLCHEANHKVAVLGAAKTAFDHKKKQLENLTSLVISGHLAEPRIGQLMTERKEVYDRMNESEVINKEGGLKDRLKKKLKR